MTAGANKPGLPPEVLAAIDAFMRERRRDPSPISISEAVDAVQRVFPEHSLPYDALANAVAFAATSTQHYVHFDKIATPDMASDRARWTDDGGSPPSANQT